MLGRAPQLMNGAATSSAGSKLSADRQARVAGIEDAVVLLLGTFRVVAQPLQLEAGFRPGALQIDALFTPAAVAAANLHDGAEFLAE
jgi:hypothetical protein